MNRWKVIIGILLIFAVGAFSGALGTGFYTKTQIRRFVDPKGPPPPIRILERRLDGLGLSAEQQHKTDALLEQMHTEFFEIIQKTRPEIEEHFNRHVQLLRAELTPEQQQSFDKTIQRIHARMKQMTAPPFRRKPSKASPSQMQAELDLTPEQVQKSEDVIASMKKKKGEILYHWKTDRAQLHKKLKADMEALMDEMEGELATFLSAEQAKRLRESLRPAPLL